MAEIYKMGKEISEEEINSAIEGLAYIFDMPDSMFKAVFPRLKEEFIKTIKNGEFEKDLLQKGISSEERKKITNELKELKLAFQNEGYSSEKIEFLDLIIEATNQIINNTPYRDSVTVAVEFCHPNAKEPTYANPDDAGCDVYAVETTHIAPGATVIVKTGLKVAVPAGWMLSVRPRSGMSAKTGIRVANAPGTIKVVK